MKPFRKYVLCGLIIALFPNIILAGEIQNPNSPQNADYLAHWFKVDSAEPINMVITPLEDDQLGKRSKLSFTSDDRRPVNGIIAFPTEDQSPTKVAFALHPMGTDQTFWWSDKSPLAANHLTEHLRKLGYTVISLDARRHGQRAIEGFGPRELLARAHSAEPRLYIDTIIGSVRDYRTVLNWSKTEFQPARMVALGYSMGAQMSLLLASYEPSIDAVLAMVPPYVQNPTSPVAPRVHVTRIDKAKVLWLAGRKDRYSTVDQTKEAFNKVKSKDSSLSWFDSGHRLPNTYMATAIDFFDSLQTEVK